MKTKYIKPLILANLLVICLTNCSLTPSRQVDLQKLADSLPALPNPNKNLRNSPTLNANPPWLKKLVETARKLGEDEEVSLFPAGMMRNYVPARQPGKKFVKITSGYDVRKDSGISAAKLNKAFKGVMSGKGEVVIKAGRENGIDPAFLAAIITQESGSSYSSLYARKYSNVMGRLYRDKRTGKWLPMKFRSVENCISETAKHLRINYIQKGLTNISSIQNRYCPVITNSKSKDYNDFKGVNSHWRSGVVRHMNKFQSI